MPMDEKKALDQLTSIWNNECKRKRDPLKKTHCPLPASAKASLDEKLQHLFLSLNHSKPLQIETQSLFIAIWANVNIQSALNYLLMDVYCTKIDIFAISILLKQFSSTNSAYYCPLIKSIWSAILPNQVLSRLILSGYGVDNVASYSLLTLAIYDVELNTAMNLLNATQSRQQIISLMTLKSVMEKLLHYDKKREYRWAIKIFWSKSARYYSRHYVESILEMCDVYGLTALRQEILQNSRFARPKNIINS